MELMHLTEILLLAYIGTFLFAKALLIRRDSPFGWSFATTNLFLGFSFWYAVSLRLWPSYPATLWLSIGIRIFLAASVTWAFWLLILYRRRHG